ncbi:hypothetical protein PoB_004270500 [Plakobranchus ocellatus]|uniref:Uncharacterized protein n=1 Tax=Plakobranchus ocellatus TaxID=259542 RepID=A0AAV4BAS7_9GAST|nr:hypothetical protein PoB_004270500 [Plakobranchus ocellatus]
MFEGKNSKANGDINRRMFIREMDKVQRLGQHIPDHGRVSFVWTFRMRVISGFQAFRQARRSGRRRRGLTPRQKVLHESQGGLTSHCAIDAPQ